MSNQTDDRPRAVRNNNPGNIRELPGGGIHWEGERTTDDDPAFEEFETPAMGFRALARTLLTYKRRHGLDQISTIIARWAPPNENDTQKYIAFVAKQMAADPGQVLDMEHRANLIVFCCAIARKEAGHRKNGSDWWNLEDIAAGVDLALASAPRKPVPGV